MEEWKDLITKLVSNSDANRYIIGFAVERSVVHVMYLSCDFTSNTIKFLHSGVNEPKTV